MVEVSVPSLPDTVSYPKLQPSSTGYRYYPGYSRAFVHDILAEWPSHEVVLDPWNGSGATTAVAAELGLECVGIDLNPAMVVVAKSALLGDQDVATIRRQAYNVHQERAEVTAADHDDPLLEWFDRGSVARLRSMQAALVGSPRIDTRRHHGLGKCVSILADRALSDCAPGNEGVAKFEPDLDQITTRITAGEADMAGDCQ